MKPITSNFISLCLAGNSRSKICKSKAENNENIKLTTVYAVIGNQCNVALAKPELLIALGVVDEAVTCQMRSCSGEKFISGRSTKSLSVSSRDCEIIIKLPLVR